MTTEWSGLARLSYDQLQGRTVYGSDGGKIGKIGDLYDDDSGGAPVFATVYTGLFGSRTTFVPMTQAQLQGDDVVVPFSKDQVKGAPSIEADAEISPQEEQEILSYYGLGSGPGSAGTTGTTDTASTGTADTAGTSGTADSASMGTTGTADTADAGMATSGTAGTAGAAGHPGAATDRDRDGIPDAQEGSATAGHRHGPVGRDVSGPTTDQATTRSEEQMRVGTAQVEAGRARLRKSVVTENVTQTVSVSHEEVRVEREPITEANRGASYDGPAIKEQIDTDGDVHPGGRTGRTERDRTR